MLKKIKNSDVDNVMNIWKKAYTGEIKKSDNRDFAQIYTEVRDILMNDSSDTTLYTEDDKIEGFIIIDDKKRIVALYVDTKIRREGIGSMLIDSCKKEHNNLIVSFKYNEVCSKFFQKNNFEMKSKNDDDEYTYEWISENEGKINLIFFDSDIDEKMINKKGKLNAKRVKIGEILSEDVNLKSVKNYIKVRKSIECAFDKNVLVYLNYENYNETVNDIIKEIAKIERANMIIILSQPLITENNKIEENLNKIEQCYKDYKQYKIDILDSFKKDVSINEIMKEKMGIIISQIEKIAENM